MTDRLDATTPKANRTYTVTVDGIGQVFASDSLYNAVKEMKARGFGSGLVFGRKFAAFINDEGKARACNGCPAFIAEELA
jgi:hypothetical protein